MVAALMDEPFSKGRATKGGERLLAAVIWKLPQLARSAGCRIIRRTQVLSPGGRVPVPMSVVAKLAMGLLWSGRPNMAVLVLLTLETYCRPSEPMRLPVKDVVPDQNKTGVMATTILLHPLG